MRFDPAEPIRFEGSHIVHFGWLTRFQDSPRNVAIAVCGAATSFPAERSRDAVNCMKCIDKVEADPQLTQSGGMAS